MFTLLAHIVVYVYNILLYHVLYVGLSHGLNLSNIYSYHIQALSYTGLFRCQQLCSLPIHMLINIFFLYSFILSSG